MGPGDKRAHNHNREQDERCRDKTLAGDDKDRRRLAIGAPGHGGRAEGDAAPE